MTPTLLFFAGVPGAEKPGIHVTPSCVADSVAGDVTLVGALVVLVLGATGLLDELQAARRTAHASAATGPPRRGMAEPIDMTFPSKPGQIRNRRRQVAVDDRRSNNVRYNTISVRAGQPTGEARRGKGPSRV